MGRIAGDGTAVMKPIDVMRFRSVGRLGVLTGGSISSTTYNDTGNTSSVTFSNDGSVSASTGGIETTNTISGQKWYVGTPDQTYEIRATSVSISGTGSSSGTYGTWLSLSTNRTWSETKPSGNGGRTREALFEIRRASDQVVVLSATYTISALNAVGDIP